MAIVVSLPNIDTLPLKAAGAFYEQASILLESGRQSINRLRSPY